MPDFAPDIRQVQCASFGSFQLEENYFDFLVEQKIDVVEWKLLPSFMPLNTLINKPLLYILCDRHPQEKHVFEPMTPTQQSVIQLAQSKGAQLIKGFVQQLTIST